MSLDAVLQSVHDILAAFFASEKPRFKDSSAVLASLLVVKPKLEPAPDKPKAEPEYPVRHASPASRLIGLLRC